MLGNKSVISSCIIGSICKTCSFYVLSSFEQPLVLVLFVCCLSSEPLKSFQRIYDKLYYIKIYTEGTTLVLFHPVKAEKNI